MKLGKQEYKPDPRTLSLSNFISPSVVVPSRYDFDKKRAPFPTKNWGNDRWGDCVIAGRANHLLRFERTEQRRTLPLTDENVISEYKRLSQVAQGHMPESPGDQYDNGLVVLDALKSWRNDGWQIKGSKQRGIDVYTIAAYGELHPNDDDQLRQAIFLFHGIQLGFWLPVAAQGKDEWTYSGQTGPEWSPGSWGGHCLAPETRVLSASLEWVEIGSLNVGDKLTCFDEFPALRSFDKKATRWWRSAEVVSTDEIELECYSVLFEDGTEIRAAYDHEWLAVHPWGSEWVRTDCLKAGQTRVKKPVEPWNFDSSREAGYLAAAFDGEGCLSNHRLRENTPSVHRLSFYQSENEMLKFVEGALRERNFNIRRQSSTPGVSGTKGAHVVVSGRPDILRLLGSVRPLRLLSKFSPDSIGQFGGRDSGKGVRVVEIKKSRKRNVIALQTTTGTYLSEGFGSHNCVYAKAYTPDYIEVLSWGRKIKVYNDFIAKYCDEAWAAIDSLDYWRKRPEFDVQALISKMREIGVSNIG